MAAVADRLGRMLLGAKLITEEQLKEALVTMKQKGSGQLGGTLVKMGYL